MKISNKLHKRDTKEIQEIMYYETINNSRPNILIQIRRIKQLMNKTIIIIVCHRTTE